MPADDAALRGHDPAARNLHAARRYTLEYTHCLQPSKKHMRVTRRRNRSESGRSNRIGAVLIGALAGVAVGILLADRGMFSGVRRRRAAEGDTPSPTPRRTPPGEPVRPLRTDRVPRRPADDDAELEARVLETFRNDPVLMDRPIDIGAIGTGIIELTGWVDAPDEVRHATTLTRGTIGVHTVVNRLMVKGAGLPA
jgi:hypothetical protein